MKTFRTYLLPFLGTVILAAVSAGIAVKVTVAVLDARVQSLEQAQAATLRTETERESRLRRIEFYVVQMASKMNIPIQP